MYVDQLDKIAENIETLTKQTKIMCQQLKDIAAATKQFEQALITIIEAGMKSVPEKLQNEHLQENQSVETSEGKD